MKTTKKTTKKNVNIFVVLIIILAVLIVAMIALTQAKKIEIHNKVNNYIAHEYGEKGSEKLVHKVGTYQYTNQTFDIWESENYMYDVATGYIYDNVRNTENNKVVTESITALLDGKADGSEATGAVLSTYTESEDYSKEYNEFIVYYVANTEKVISSTDEAAAFIWEMVEAVNAVEPVTGIQINLFDNENEYTCYINAFEDTTPITFDEVKEATLLTTEKSYMYQVWQSSLEAAVVEGDTAEGENADASAENEAE